MLLFQKYHFLSSSSPLDLLGRNACRRLISFRYKSHADPILGYGFTFYVYFFLVFFVAIIEFSAKFLTRAALIKLTTGLNANQLILNLMKAFDPLLF